MTAPMTKLRPFPLWLNNKKHTDVAIEHGFPPIAEMTNRANVVNDSSRWFEILLLRRPQNHRIEGVNPFTHGETIPGAGPALARRHRTLASPRTSEEYEHGCTDQQAASQPKWHRDSGSVFWGRDTGHVVHGTELAARPDVEFVGFWGRDASKAPRQPDAVSGFGTSDLDEFLAQVDCVSIALPPTIQGAMIPPSPAAASQSLGQASRHWTWTSPARRSRPSGRPTSRPCPS